MGNLEKRFPTADNFHRLKRNMAHGPDWDTLLGDLESKIDNTPHKIDAEYGPLVNALDRLIDEIKSGEVHKPKYTSAIVKQLIRCFPYPNWNLIQTILYVLAHLFKDKDILPTLSAKFGDSHPLSTSVLDHVLNMLAFEKREIKDAAGQALGTLSATFGNALFTMGDPTLLDRFKHVMSNLPQANAEGNEYQTLEGHMFAAGYLLAKCPDVSHEHFNALMIHVLAAGTTHLYPYGNYVRLGALKALALVVRSPYARAQLALDQKLYEEKIHSIIFARLNDDDIDVRKAASRLVECWCNYLVLTTESHNRKRLGESFVEDLLSALQQSGRWEGQHGICFALSRFANPQSLLVPQLSWAEIQKVFGALDDQIKNPHKESPNVAANVSCTANAAAAVALTNLFLSLAKHQRPEGAPALPQIFESHVQNQIKWLLSQSEPALIDAGGQTLQQLIFNDETFIRPYLSSFLTLVFKNKFHASLPIRDSSIRNWKTACGSNEIQRLTEIAPHLFELLFADAQATNSEVRETVFKAFEEVFAKIGSSAELTGESLALRIFDTLSTGASNTKGTSAEYPRVAALNALNRFLSVSAASPTLSKNQKWLEKLGSASLVQWIADEHEGAAIAAMNLVVCLFKHYHTSLPKSVFARISAPLLCLVHSELENVQVAAMQTITAVFGNFATSLYTSANGELLTALANGFRGKFSFHEDIAEEEDRKRNSGAVRYLAVEIPAVLLSCTALPQNIEPLLKTIGYALLNEENRQNVTVEANALSLLYILLTKDTVRSAISANKKCVSIVSVLLKYLPAALSSAADEFEFDPKIIEKSDVSLDEDEEEDDEDEELKLKPIKNSKLEIWLCTRLIVAFRAMNAALTVLPTESQPAVAKKLERFIRAFVRATPAATNAALLALEGFQSPKLVKLREELSKAASANAPVITAETFVSSITGAAQPKAWEAAPWEACWAVACAGCDAMSTPSASHAAHAADLYKNVLSLIKRTPEKSARDRKLRGKLVDLLAAIFVHSYPNGVNAFSHWKNLISLIPESETDDSADEDANARLLLVSLDGKAALQLNEFSPHFVTRRIHSAVRDLWSHTDKPKLLHSVLEEFENFDEIDIDHALAKFDALRDLAPLYATDQQHALVKCAFAHVATKVKEGDEPAEALHSLLKMTHDVLKAAPNSHWDDHKLLDFHTAATDLCTKKWFIALDEGRVVLALLSLLVQVQAKLSHPLDSAIQQRFLQLLADTLANEDLAEHRASFFPAIQELALERSVILPPPTSPTGPINEQFAKFT